MTTKIGVIAGRAYKRSGNRTLRGWRGWVLMPDGTRMGCNCCHKSSANAIDCATQQAKRLGKQHGIEVVQ